ncbi:hypothetical protein [[Flexibacter] sp. ATCC 35103]|uniref:hypothetical protein n=1 Tax=[Flexibacter] sp. ATCC 35103 TaxID=1937528 RepID=UPI0009D5B76F|nr:hypothetical protein [[Flexibacter] sp. ATCC 35103]OMQ13356.1 hypothetical protein BXU01_02425 [[Flexibacter] sp. ATCC 35103]
MSNTPASIDKIKIKLHNLIIPHLSELELTGFKIIDNNTKILNLQDSNYLLIDGIDAFFYDLNASKIQLHSINDLEVINKSNTFILKYFIIEDVWKYNFVNADNLELLEQAKLNEFNVIIKDSDFEQEKIDRIILDNTNVVNTVKIKGIDYTLFNYAKK